MKRFFFPALTFLFLIFPSLASAQTNSVVMTSYYPAPFGAYDRMRLVPRASLGATCTAGEEGSLYIPNTTNTINQCTSGNWLPLSGGVFTMMPATPYKNDLENPLVDVDQYYPVKPYPDLSANAPYLGIGTATPKRPVHIAVKNTNNVVTALALENTGAAAAGVANGVGISFYNVDTTPFPAVPFTRIASIEANSFFVNPDTGLHSSLDFSVLNGRGGIWQKIMTLNGQAGGRVGIHVLNPNAVLEIAKVTTPITDYIRITNAISGDILNIDSNGNVGINKNAPTERLEVAGNIKAATLILTSDAGLKKDIVPVENSLDKISRLNGVSFEWKNNPSDQRKHMGVIAQDVEKVFPEAVYGKDGAKGVDYPSLIAPLIEAVKELRGKNDVLSQQLQAQSAQIREQQKKIESLQSSLQAKEPVFNP